jgi:hypothetical protein
MTTGQDWISQTRSYLMSGYAENRNKLSLPYTAGSGTLTFKYPMDGIRSGARLSIGTNTFYVWSTTGQTAEVQAGEDSSTDVSVGIGTLVRVAPRFTGDEIWKQLANDLGDLASPSNGLFGIQTVDLTYNATLNGYDLGPVADNLLSIYEVKYLTPGPQLDNPRIHTTGWRLNRNANTSQFPSGLSLQMFEPAYPGYNVRVVYRSNFTMPTTTLANVSSTGLLSSAYDLPPLGAAIRLMEGREIKRNFTEGQGDTRRAGETPPGAVLQSARGLQQLRANRISAEAAKLEALYPNFKA